VDDLLVEHLPGKVEERGLSVSVLSEYLRAIGPVEDVHIAAIRPGAVRGNHFHTRKQELIAVAYQDRWSLHWDRGAGSAPQRRDFTGAGGVVIRPPVGWSHAIRNDSDSDLWIVALSDRAFDPDEAVTRQVVAPA
jgi:oxalate decarboxylase/phosphoglucose isomerase-like protein (cupin superfamily)